MYIHTYMFVYVCMKKLWMRRKFRFHLLARGKGVCNWIIIRIYSSASTLYVETYIRAHIHVEEVPNSSACKRERCV
jgi:hypothetical protein